jgi:DNA-binding HxlR family transcriptional regulator
VVHFDFLGTAMQLLGWMLLMIVSACVVIPLAWVYAAMVSLGGRMNLWQDGSEVRLLRARLGLDSGYFSRQLRRLEADRLVTTDPDDGDGRVRKVRLTRKGLAERAVLDSSSNELAASILTPLTEPQRDRLVYRDGRR